MKERRKRKRKNQWLRAQCVRTYKKSSNKVSISCNNYTRIAHVMRIYLFVVFILSTSISCLMHHFRLLGAVLLSLSFIIVAAARFLVSSFFKLSHTLSAAFTCCCSASIIFACLCISSYCAVGSKWTTTSYFAWLTLLGLLLTFCDAGFLILGTWLSIIWPCGWDLIWSCNKDALLCN